MSGISNRKKENLARFSDKIVLADKDTRQFIIDLCGLLRETQTQARIYSAEKSGIFVESPKSKTKRK